MLKNKIKKVPVYNKQELLSYLAEKEESTLVIIVTSSGKTYKGIVVKVEGKDKDVILLLQIVSPEDIITENILHITIDKIESLEFIESQNVLNILSKGTVFDKIYDTSGKLQVKKALRRFSDVLQDTYGLKIGAPKIILPTNGYELNRVLQLTEQLQHIMVNILEEEDALISWKASYDSITFIDDDSLKVIQNYKTIEIHFPFTNINLPEMPAKEVTAMILNVL
ncbi:MULTISPECIES: hypothetical protein [Aquimarina]|uniref:hypothetical protein n=1 Tax=Aquimarina TaxID=290174 RepID=UPI000D68950B|nr:MULTISPECIES: hypothetical protein [Aquimarina]